MQEMIRTIADTFAFNSSIVTLALGDIDQAKAGYRLRQGAGSSILFLTGHLLSSRYGVLRMLGAGDDNPYAEDFGAEKPPKDANEYPALEQFRRDWDAVASRLGDALAAADPDTLLAPSPPGFPVDDQTVRGAINFLQWHESYHVGQIGILRTEQGMTSTKDQVHAAMAAKS